MPSLKSNVSHDTTFTSSFVAVCFLFQSIPVRPRCWETSQRSTSLPNCLPTWNPDCELSSTEPWTSCAIFQICSRVKGWPTCMDRTPEIKQVLRETARFFFFFFFASFDSFCSYKWSKIQGNMCNSGRSNVWLWCVMYYLQYFQMKKSFLWATSTRVNRSKQRCLLRG